MSTKTKAPDSNAVNVKNWPSFAATVFRWILDSPWVMLYVAAAVVLFLIWRLEPKDLLALLKSLIEQRWFAVGGWVVAAIGMGCMYRAFKWRERFFQEEIERREKHWGQMKGPQQREMFEPGTS